MAIKFEKYAKVEILPSKNMQKYVNSVSKNMQKLKFYPRKICKFIYVWVKKI